MGTQGSHQIARIVGANIREARGRHGLTQIELAVRLRTSVSRVSNWENGHHLPRNPQAVADELLDGDVAALYREPEPEPEGIAA